MATTRTAANGRHDAPHVSVHEEGSSYVIELNVADFAPDELAVETLGYLVTIRGEQREAPAERHLPFRLHERLVETFRLPDDADLDEITASYEHGTLELRVLRAPLESRRVAIGGVEVGRIHPDVAPI